MGGSLFRSGPASSVPLSCANVAFRSAFSGCETERANGLAQRLNSAFFVFCFFRKKKVESRKKGLKGKRMKHLFSCLNRPFSV